MKTVIVCSIIKIEADVAHIGLNIPKLTMTVIHKCKTLIVDLV